MRRGIKMIEWKFKEDAKSQGSDEEFWFNMANDGINLSEILEGESLQSVEHAFDILYGFVDALVEVGLVEIKMDLVRRIDEKYRMEMGI
jgi:hypothetical protein|tara:strand:+ start:1403 stop:1669 length:267 start_codon:yes stop_codon:yes gene_type:complete